MIPESIHELPILATFPIFMLEKGGSPFQTPRTRFRKIAGIIPEFAGQFPNHFSVMASSPNTGVCLDQAILASSRMGKELKFLGGTRRFLHIWKCSRDEMAHQRGAISVCQEISIK
jgi:hypothetical protein